MFQYKKDIRRRDGGREKGRIFMLVSDTASVELIAGMKQAMRRLAASVVVVTARDGDTRYAMAASSCTSLSMEPPSLVLCVNKTASIYSVLNHGKDFCVNVLSGAHEAVSVACSGAVKGEARFATGDWRDDPDTNTPFLGDAQASDDQSDGKQPKLFPYEDGVDAAMCLINRMPPDEFNKMLNLLIKHRNSHIAAAS